MPSGRPGMRWQEKSQGKLWWFLDAQQRPRGTVLRISEKEFRWFLSGTTLQGECASLRKAKDAIEEQLRIMAHHH